MRTYSRRTILSALGAALPFGLGARAGTGANSGGSTPVIRFRRFEEAVREAFSGHGPGSSSNETDRGRAYPCRRVEVGDSDLVRAGIQGCHNDRPFAGFPAGHLSIVRAGAQPGPMHQGVRLYVTTVDVVVAAGLPRDIPSRPLDFASLPPAPSVSERPGLADRT